MPMGTQALFCADPLARRDALQQPAVADDEGSVNDYETKAIGILCGILECGLVDDAIGIEDRDIGIRTNFQSAFLPHLWRRGFEPLCRHERALANRIHQ